MYVYAFSKHIGVYANICIVYTTYKHTGGLEGNSIYCIDSQENVHIVTAHCSYTWGKLICLAYTLYNIYHLYTRIHKNKSIQHKHKHKHKQ